LEGLLTDGKKGKEGLISYARNKEGKKLGRWRAGGHLRLFMRILKRTLQKRKRGKSKKKKIEASHPA